MTYLPGDILVKVDRAAMANSLETRPPFLDHDFVAWSFSLDTKAKVDGGEGKSILKKGMEAASAARAALSAEARLLDSRCRNGCAARCAT